jgi:tRNA(Ile)-lysidine synthase TilS/MesJ
VGVLRALCKEIEVELVVCESTLPLERLECYSCSRERRGALFAAATERGIRTMAFGHHRDDTVQTLLMNLLHKAEFAAMLPKVPLHHYGITLIRPLLYIAEEQIREFAKLYGFSRISCQCPVGQNSLRQKTKQLLIDIEKLYPNARSNLSQAALMYGSDKALRP